MMTWTKRMPRHEVSRPGSWCSGSMSAFLAGRRGFESLRSHGKLNRGSEDRRPVVQRENTRLITGRRRFDSFLADSTRNAFRDRS